MWDTIIAETGGRNDDSLNRSREHEDCPFCGCHLEGVNGYKLLYHITYSIPAPC